MAEYIDKEEAINRIREWEQYVVDSMRKCPIFGELNERYIQQKCSGLEMAIRIIKGMPSADVVPRKDYESMERTVDKLNKALAERKRGMWQIVEKHIEYRTERCSICGFVANRTYIRDIWNFCPNCGADMRGKE